MSSDNTAEAPTYHLSFSKRGVTVTKGKKGQPDTWTIDKGRKSRLPNAPKDFQPLTGAYKEVADHAVKLNNIQIKHGFVDWLYSAETTSPLEEAPA